MDVDRLASKDSGQCGLKDSHARLARLGVELKLTESLQGVNVQDLGAGLARRDVLPDDARPLSRRESGSGNLLRRSLVDDRTAHLALEAEAAPLDAVLSAQPLIDPVARIARQRLGLVDDDLAICRAVSHHEEESTVQAPQYWHSQLPGGKTRISSPFVRGRARASSLVNECLVYDQTYTSSSRFSGFSDRRFAACPGRRLIVSRLISAGTAVAGSSPSSGWATYRACSWLAIAPAYSCSDEAERCAV